MQCVSAEGGGVVFRVTGQVFKPQVNPRSKKGQVAVDGRGAITQFSDDLLISPAGETR